MFRKAGKSYAFVDSVCDVRAFIVLTNGYKRYVL